MIKSPCATCEKINENKLICSKNCKKLEEYQNKLPIQTISFDNIDTEYFYINKYIFKDISFSESLKNLL